MINRSKWGWLLLGAIFLSGFNRLWADEKDPAQSMDSQPFIGLYEVFEIELQGKESTNPYVDAWLKGQFSAPGVTIEIYGFWDGGTSWKVRMAPTQVGMWNYTITSSDANLNLTGSFECVNSGRKGFLKKNPEYPCTFMYADGTPFLWKGETSWRAFTSSVPYESHFIPYIDKRSSEGFNAVHSILVSYINGLDFWKNEGGLIFDESSGSKNYDLLNPDYFHWVDSRIAYMVSKDMVPVVFFTWAQELVNFSEEQFKRFERYVIARYAAYNVVWVISGEYDETYKDYGWTPADIERYCNYAYSLDPYKHPITLHPTGQSSSREFGNRDWLGCVMQQGNSWHSEILMDRIFSKPVVNGEYGYAGKVPDDDVRIGAWEIITAGGFFSAGFFTTYAPDKGGWNLQGNQQQASELTTLFNFFAATEWWKMTPHDNLVNKGHCLAQPGKEYVIYLPQGGSVSLNLQTASGMWPVEWLNPRTGSYHKTAEIAGGGTILLTAPFSGDAVIHVGKWPAEDQIPPNPPKNLTGKEITEQSLTLSWDAPDPAVDGDQANQYLIYRDGQFIAAVVTTFYTDSQLAENTTYSYGIFSIDDHKNKSLEAADGRFTTAPDLIAPRIVNAWLASATQLNILFSEPVELQSATLIDNYRIEPAVTIERIELFADERNLTLTTGLHGSGQVFTLNVSNVKDKARNANRIVQDTRIAYMLIPDLLITNLVPSNYRLEKLVSGDRYYIDRDYVLERVPPILKNDWWIMTANDDKEATSDNFLTFDTNQDVEVFVGFDASSINLPAWLQAWECISERIATTDDSDFVLYRKKFTAGRTQLGANNGDGASSMYLVIVQSARKSDSEPPAQPIGVHLRAK